MAASITDDKVAVEGRTPIHEISDEKVYSSGDIDYEKKGGLDTEISIAPPLDNDDDYSKDNASDDVIIITGADAAAHLLPMRDDGESALTFRSILLATCLSAFQAVMSQIYSVGNLSMDQQSSYAYQAQTDALPSSNQPP